MKYTFASDFVSTLPHILFQGQPRLAPLRFTSRFSPSLRSLPMSVHWRSEEISYHRTERTIDRPSQFVNRSSKRGNRSLTWQLTIRAREKIVIKKNRYILPDKICDVIYWMRKDGSPDLQVPGVVVELYLGVVMLDGGTILPWQTALTCWHRHSEQIKICGQKCLCKYHCII